MIPRFELHRPSDLREALALLGELEDVACYAGGTELVQVMKMGFAQVRHLVDLKRIAELGGIDELPDGTLRIGATVTHREIEGSSAVGRRLPVLAELERQIANVRIRNVGTLGGNLCFAEPHSDPAALLLACEATVTLAGPDGGRRSMGLGDFLLDALTTAREEGEIMTGVTVPPLPADGHLAYRRLALTERPTVSVACRLRVTDDGRIEEPRIVVGSVGPRPVVCLASEQLSGLSVDAVAGATEEIAQACAAEVEPLDDLDLAPAYLRNLVAVSVGRALADSIGGTA